MSKLTPMMQQYMNIKKQYGDCILFFRLGDFYEMFFEDARTASKVLEITLTGRDCGLKERAPMCGVPFHSADSYISKLINNGYKIAICEQVEDPETAKGIVKRDVIRVITPGTVTDNSLLEEKKNNYLLSIYKCQIYFGLASVDVSTGEFNTTWINWGDTYGKVMNEIAKYSPSEIIVNSDFYKDKSLKESIDERFNTYITLFDDKYFKEKNSMENIKRQFGDNDILQKYYNFSVNASGALIEYLEQTQKVNLKHIKTLNYYTIEEFMVLDVSSRRNLELTETMRDRKRKGSLLWVMDRTMTSMGGRMLRKWLEQPLIDTGDINKRLDAVQEIRDKFMARMEIREYLKNVYDIERLISKVVFGSVNCRDLTAIKNSLARIPCIKSNIKKCDTDLICIIDEMMDPLEDAYKLIEDSICEDPPVTVREGGIIKTGFNEQVDKLRSAAADGKNRLASMENSEREKTGIKNLKVGYNKVFGYYLEVTKSYYELVPENYIRKQTLANSERYITEELKEMENHILGAEEKVVDLEYRLFTEVRDEIAVNVDRFKNTAKSLAMIDVLSCLAEVSEREGYCRPEITENGMIKIKDGRHPVVEKTIKDGEFVPNDTNLDMNENRAAIITGPNMAGKSTYLRQTALIVLMAQIGSFVPAKSASIGIVDRIFTRVGASDDLASGQSTFMVEMSEVANILKNATSKSLLILDEIGRGTSTYDGLSIAWAVTEFVSSKNKIGGRTLFATHYHELTELEGKINGIKNYCISVEKKGEDIIFLRKIIRGGADQSYGIQVAKLAGVPELVIERSKEILNELENADISKKEIRKTRTGKPLEGQLDLMTYRDISKTRDKVFNEIINMDISKLTPIDALNILYNLQQKIKKG